MSKEYSANIHMPFYTTCPKTDMPFYRHDFLHYCSIAVQPPISMDFPKQLRQFEFTIKTKNGLLAAPRMAF